MAINSANGSGRSALDILESAFQALVRGPRPIAVDGAALGHGLPARAVPLDELRALLLHPSLPYAARDAVWRELVRLARTEDPSWVVGAAGVALPGLRVLAGELARGFHGDSHDLDAEMLSGFVIALRELDLSRGKIAARLSYAAYNAGRRLRRRMEDSPGRHGEFTCSGPPPAPWGHPDLVLGRAVGLGIITPLHADLIGRTRLEDVPLQQAAAELGLSYFAAWRRRDRAEHRLAEAIRASQLEDLEPPASKNRPLGGICQCRDTAPAPPANGDGTRCCPREQPLPHTGHHRPPRAAGQPVCRHRPPRCAQGRRLR
jgi:hypothetical protein